MPDGSAKELPLVPPSLESQRMKKTLIPRGYYDAFQDTDPQVGLRQIRRMVDFIGRNRVAAILLVAATLTAAYKHEYGHKEKTRIVRQSLFRS